jgi:hypothetical protein
LSSFDAGCAVTQVKNITTKATRCVGDDVTLLAIVAVADGNDDVALPINHQPN